MLLFSFSFRIQLEYVVLFGLRQEDGFIFFIFLLAWLRCKVAALLHREWSVILPFYHTNSLFVRAFSPSLASHFLKVNWNLEWIESFPQLTPHSSFFSFLFFFFFFFFCWSPAHPLSFTCNHKQNVVFSLSFTPLLGPQLLKELIARVIDVTNLLIKTRS